LPIRLVTVTPTCKRCAAVVDGDPCDVALTTHGRSSRMSRRGHRRAVVKLVPADE